MYLLAIQHTPLPNPPPPGFCKGLCPLRRKVGGRGNVRAFNFFPLPLDGGGWGGGGAKQSKSHR